MMRPPPVGNTSATTGSGLPVRFRQTHRTWRRTCCASPSRSLMRVTTSFSAGCARPPLRMIPSGPLGRLIVSRTGKALAGQRLPAAAHPAKRDRPQTESWPRPAGRPGLRWSSPNIEHGSLPVRRPGATTHNSGGWMNYYYFKPYLAFW